MKPASYMDNQSEKYYRDMIASETHSRRFWMREARGERDLGFEFSMSFNIGMAKDASWRVRYMKRQLRNLGKVPA